MCAQSVLDPFLAREDLTGFRASWSCFCVNSADRAKIAVPTGAMYTLLKPLLPEQFNPNQPILCSKCGAVFSINDQIFAAERSYACRFCGTANKLPDRITEISEQNRPLELQYQTLEYPLPGAPPHPLSMIFVIDTCVSSAEVKSLISTLTQILALIPSHFRVGIVTTGMANHIYDLSSTETISTHSFNSAKEYTNVQFCEMLGLNSLSHTEKSSLLVPVGEGMLQLTAALNDIERDPYGDTEDQRETNGMGGAIALALAVLEALNPDSPGRVMVFQGTPCTAGPGQVLSTDKTEQMRQRINLERETDLKYFDKATAYYTRLAQRAAAQGHCVDLFIAAQDQVGLSEMQPLVDLTGGFLVLSTAFSAVQFRLSLTNLFDRGDGKAEDLDMAFNCHIRVKMSEHMKLTGIFGPCARLRAPAPWVHTIETGKGGTSEWVLNALTSQTTLCINWEVTLPDTSTEMRRPPCMQIQTTYTLPTGQRVLRITTIDFRWNDNSKQLRDVTASFDCECAAGLIARYACWRAEGNRNDGYCQTAVHWIDKTLIKLCQRLATYTPLQPATFALPPQLTALPQLMFSLRRSRFLRVFNHAPDETSFYRTILNQETVSNMVVMMLPTLLSFELGKEEPTPVLLDMMSVKKDCILLLDTYFRIIIHHGETIAYWREQNQHLLPQNAALKAMLEAPSIEAQEILKDRFPVPTVLVCDQGSSQARFLVSQLNPSTSRQSNEQGGPTTHTTVFSDDFTFKTFYDRLKATATQNQSQ